MTTATISFSELGIVPETPGRDMNGCWMVTLLGGAMRACTAFHFADEPEDRAVETLMAYLGAGSAFIRPPVAA